MLSKWGFLFMLACGVAAGKSNKSCSSGGLSMLQLSQLQQIHSEEPENPALPETESVCGAGEEILDVDCLKPSNMPTQINQSKATLLMGLGCTAWIVKLPTGSKGAMVLTAGHCGRNEQERFYFDFNTPCGGRDSQAVKNKMCQGKRLALESALDDYTVYELDLACQYVNGITPFLLDVGEPARDEGMYLIGHPNWRPKKISFQEVHDDGHHCEVRSFSVRRAKSGTSKRVRYYCDTMGGNSGSPVISARTGYAFAIHTHGGCSGNVMSANSGSLLKNSIGVLRQFGIPFVDRRTTDIFKQIHFTKKSVCPKSKTQIRLRNKKLNECKITCMNALKCVGFTHSGSGTDCAVVYEVHQGKSEACPGSSAFYERVYSAFYERVNGIPPSPRPTPSPVIPTPSPKPQRQPQPQRSRSSSCRDTDNRCARWKGRCSNRGVQKKCPKTCNRCGSKPSCRDIDNRCARWKGRCSNRGVQKKCPKTCDRCGSKPSCRDIDNRCARWKGRCSNRGVQKKCPRTCNCCGLPGKCKDKSKRCQQLKKRCSKSNVKAICPLTCGVCANSGS